MATSADHKEIPDEVDGKNKVTPAGEEKSKKKGLFGKSAKSESKAKSKETKKTSKGKEDLPEDDPAKEKKSEKTESKKEGIII